MVSCPPKTKSEFIFSKFWKRGSLWGGGGEFTKIFKNFFYQLTLMKFDSSWFLSHLKPNLKPIFWNSEKGSLGRGGGRGDSPKFSNFLFINRFWWQLSLDGFLPSQNRIWSHFCEILKKGVPRGGFTKNFKIFVYERILMKFGAMWFFGLLKPNLMSIFRNSQKGPLGMGGGGNFLKNLLPNRFW